MFWLQTVYMAERDGLDPRRAAWQRVGELSRPTADTVTVWAAPRSPSESLAMSVSILLAYRATTPLAGALLAAAPPDQAVTHPSSSWQPVVLELDARLISRLPVHWCVVLPGDDSEVLEIAGQLATEGMAPALAFEAARALARH